MEKILKWRTFVKLFLDIPQYHLREKQFAFIDERDLMVQDSLIFSLEKHIQSLKALSEKLRILELKKINEKQKKQIPPRPEKPEEPDQDDCCGSGCQVCVFDRYYQKLEEYEEKLMDWEDKYGDLSEDDEKHENQPTQNEGRK